MAEKIDFEKDYLVVSRNKQGKFTSFRWYSSEKATKEIIEDLIVKWNKGQGEDGFPAELITDPLVREICAYKESSAPYDSIVNDAREIQKSVDDAIETLEYVVDKLRYVKGLEL